MHDLKQFDPKLLHNYCKIVRYVFSKSPDISAVYFRRYYAHDHIHLISGNYMIAALCEDGLLVVIPKGKVKKIRKSKEWELNWSSGIKYADGILIKEVGKQFTQITNMNLEKIQYISEHSKGLRPTSKKLHDKKLLNILLKIADEPSSYKSIHYKTDDTDSKAVLLNWNPKNNHNYKEKKEFADSWTTGSIRRLPKGIKVFLIRVGKEPKGIIGSGISTSLPYKRKGDTSRGNKRKYGLYVDCIGSP